MTDGTDETDGDDDSDDVASMYERDGAPEDAHTPESSTDNTGPDNDSGETGNPEPEINAPTVEAGSGELEDITGTFYVKYAQENSVTLHEVNTAQICTLIENPGFERHEIVEAVLKEQPPMGVSYLVEHLEEQFKIPAEYSEESLTTQVQGIGSEELDVGEAVPIEREGKGEIHILKVEPAQTAATVDEILDDETTYKNAARYDHVERVELRTDTEEGIVSVRYLP